MKLTLKLLVLFFGVLMLANIANAETPREQLRQMVEQLQQSPSDDAMREKIIKLARTVKPAVPEEAEKFEGRAQFAFKNAKSPADYLDAAKEYEKAIAAAPWVAGYYADLCTIYEKAEKYAEAKKSCEFFLASSPSVQDASDVRKRIAGLEFAIEKGASKKNQEEGFLKKLDGARFVSYMRNDYKGGDHISSRKLWEIRGNKAFNGFVVDASTFSSQWPPIGVIQWDPKGYIITGHQFVMPRDDQRCSDAMQFCFDETQIISEDGSKIIERRTFGSTLGERIYMREK